MIICSLPCCSGPRSIEMRKRQTTRTSATRHRAVATDCTTPMANDAKRVANTQDPTAKRRLRAERERAHRNRIKSCSVFPEQPLSIRDLICGFVANQREEWDSLPEYVRVRDYFGGHQFSGVREELGFGFMVEDVHYGICRIWSRAWLNRGHPIKPFRYSNSN